MGLSENIKKRRMELNISQQELANALNYKSRSTIAKIESGKIELSDDKILKFAHVLDTNVEFLKNELQDNKIVIKDNHESKNVAIILAGGKSTRNMQNIPNQFINVLGKPIIIYCLEAYQNHPAIDDIYIVCLKNWEKILNAYAKQYNINKLKGIIPAGETGIESIKNGINNIQEKYANNDIIILQESTRPLITEEMISKLLHSCANNDSAITCEYMREHVQFIIEDNNLENNNNCQILNRDKVIEIQSPEAYKLSTIKEIFKKAENTNHVLSETCFALLAYNLNFNLKFYEGNHNNIKIIRQEDIIILGALLKNRI